jgi:F-type H+-transporting ATPase subunit delta
MLKLSPTRSPSPSSSPTRFDHLFLVATKNRKSHGCCFQSLINGQEVTQVNLSAASGDMGILAHHVPTIEPLRAGVVEVIDANGQSKKWFGE